MPALAASSPQDVALNAFNQRDYRQATADFKSLVQAHPGDNRLLYDLARSQYMAGQVEDAGVTLKRLIRREPKSGDALYLQGLVNVAMVNRVNVFRKIGFAKRSLADLQKAVQVSPSDVYSRYALLSYYAKAPGFAGGSLAKARQQLRVIKSLNPAWGYLAASVLDRRAKHYKSAETHLKQAAANLPDRALANFTLARFYLNRKHYRQALAALREFDRAPKTWRDPETAEALYLEGKIHAQLNNAHEARLAYNQALTANPPTPLKRLIESGLREL